MTFQVLNYLFKNCIQLVKFTLVSILQYFKNRFHPDDTRFVTLKLFDNRTTGFFRKILKKRPHKEAQTPEDGELTMASALEEREGVYRHVLFLITVKTRFLRLFCRLRSQHVLHLARNNRSLAQAGRVGRPASWSVTRPHARLSSGTPRWTAWSPTPTSCATSTSFWATRYVNLEMFVI